MASYEFLLPVRINNIAVPHPPKTPFPASPYPVKGNPIKNVSPVKAKQVNQIAAKDSDINDSSIPVNTPSKKVRALAIKNLDLVMKPSYKLSVKKVKPFYKENFNEYFGLK